MKIEEWMVAESNLDDKQYDVYMSEPNKSMIVAGSAGSGKTVLAVLRAKRMSGLGSYVLLVFNKALKSMIEFGLKAHKLSTDTAIYAWAWENRGMDLSGLVYFKVKKEGEATIYLPDTIYSQKDSLVKVYKISNSLRKAFYDKQYQDYVQNYKTLSTPAMQAKETELSKFVGVDFADYATSGLYQTFGRRRCFYELDNTITLSSVDLSNRDKFESVGSAVLYIPYKFKINYLILDEAQDFSEDQISNFNKDYTKSIVYFGDTNQKLSEKGTNIEKIKDIVKHEKVNLVKNYRITKEIARIAEYLLPMSERTLVERCNKNWGNPLPVLRKCKSVDEQIDFIIRTIDAEGLTDVGILVPTNNLVEIVAEKMQEKNNPVQRRYNKPLNGFGKSTTDFMTGEFGGSLYHQLDNLNFHSTLPCVLTYHSAKGTQFNTVFIPFTNDSMYSHALKKSALYVAITRSSKELYLLFEGTKSSLLNDIPINYFKVI